MGDARTMVEFGGTGSWDGGGYIFKSKNQTIEVLHGLEREEERMGDGLQNAWPKRVWVVPPIRLLNLIPRLLTKWRPEIAVIITPDWQAQPWYQALRAMPELRSTILRRIVPRAALPNHTK